MNSSKMTRTKPTRRRSLARQLQRQVTFLTKATLEKPVLLIQRYSDTGTQGDPVRAQSRYNDPHIIKIRLDQWNDGSGNSGVRFPRTVLTGRTETKLMGFADGFSQQER